MAPLVARPMAAATVDFPLPLNPETSTSMGGDGQAYEVAMSR